MVVTQNDADLVALGRYYASLNAVARLNLDYERGPADPTGQALMALALGVSARCDRCIGDHVQALFRLGTARQELDETLGVVVHMGGGPALM